MKVKDLNDSILSTMTETRGRHFGRIEGGVLQILEI